MTVINGDEFDELLEMARSLLGANEGASDLWDANDAVNRARNDTLVPPESGVSGLPPPRTIGALQT